MQLLLDTHMLLWSASQPQKLSKKALSLILNADNKLFFSIASLWEIAIKCTLRKVDFNINPQHLRRGLLRNGLHELPIYSEHAVGVSALLMHHKDPFDRMLISQAVAEGMWLVTSDEYIARYPGPIQRV